MGELLSNISTADTARDLDHLRALSGDEQITYVGFSYGSMLGQTYANMFPEQVRAMMLDGIVDAVEYTASAEARAANNASSPDVVFDQFAKLCDQTGQRRCALAGHPGQTAAQRGPAVRDPSHRNDPGARRRPAGRAGLQRSAAQLVLPAAQPEPVAGVGRVAERRRRR